MLISKAILLSLNSTCKSMFPISSLNLGFSITRLVRHNRYIIRDNHPTYRDMEIVWGKFLEKSLTSCEICQFHKLPNQTCNVAPIWGRVQTNAVHNQFYIQHKKSRRFRNLLVVMNVIKIVQKW